MSSIVKKIGDLAPLESFDPNAFKGDAKVSQDVCNFVLTLALIFNDLKDLIFAQVTLQGQKPIGTFKVNRSWGDYNGIDLHIWKLMVGLFHEIIDFVKRSEKVLADPFFLSVLNRLRKTERDIWLSLVDASRAKTVPAENHFALLIRNKVVFHYDPKEIYWGYSTFFASGSPGAERALVSRGNDMASTRLFFADAAVTGYLTKKGQESEKMILKTIDTLCQLNLTLTEIVNHFIQKRGFPYKAEIEER